MSSEEQKDEAAEKEAPGIAFPRKRRLRSFLYASVGLLVVLAALGVLLPEILSTTPARRAILEEVRQRSGMDLRVKSWRLSWRRGLRFEGVRLTDAGRGVRFDAETVSVGGGLLDLYGPTCRVGRVELQSPVLSVHLPGPGAEPEVSSGPRGRGVPGQPPKHVGRSDLPRSAPLESSPSKPWDLTALLSLTNGVIEIHTGTNAPVVIGDVNGTVGLPSLKEPLAFRVKGVSGKGGHLGLQGVCENMREGLAGFRGRVDMALQQVSLEQFASLLPEPADVRGLISGLIRVEGRVAGWAATGRVEVVELVVADIADSPDSLRCAAVALDAAMAGSEDGIEVSRLDLTSSLGGFRASGRWQRPESAWSSTGRLAFEWPRVAACFPHTLRLQEGVKPVAGQVRLGWDLRHSAQASRGDLSLSVSNLAAEVSGSVVRLSEPLELRAVGEWSRFGPVVEALDFSSSFARIRGSGDSHGLQLSAAGDIARAMAEAGQFFDMGDLRLTGQFSGGLAASYLPTNRTLQSAWDLKDFVIQSGTNAPLDLGVVQFGLTGAVAVAGDRTVEGVEDLGVTFSNRLLRARMTADSLRWRRGDTNGFEVQSGNWKIEAPLWSLVASAKSLDLLPAEMVARGLLTATGSVSGSGEKGLKLQAALQGREVVVDNKKVSVYEEAPQVTVIATLNSGEWVVERMVLSSSVADIEAAGGLRPAVVGTQGEFVASGQLTVNYQRVSDFLLALTPVELDAGGRRAGTFRLRIPLDAEGGWLWREVRAELPVELDRLEAYGIKIGAITKQPILLADGVLAWTVSAAANGGTVELPLKLTLNEDPMVLRLKEPTRVLQQVQITDEMADSCLSRLHPVFRECSMLSGYAGLRAESFSLPLVTNLVSELTFDGSLSLSNTVLKAKGPLLELMNAVGVPVKEIHMQDQSINVSVARGWATASELTSRVDKVSLVLKGRIGLDGALDYRATVPVSREWVNDRVWPYVKDIRLSVPLKGTLSDPVVPVDALRKETEKMAKDAWQKVLEDKGGDLLDRLFR